MNPICKKLQVLAAAVVMLASAAAWAHAQLDHASPAVGSTVDAAPREVRIWFDDEVNPAGTTIQVFDAGGKQVDLKDVKQDAKDKKLMAVSLPASLPPGSYSVKWNALCMQGHKTQGEFKFTIGPKK